MRYLALITMILCAGVSFSQDESSSSKEKKYQRWENGVLKEDKYYLEKDGERVAGEDFEMPEMDLKMAEMEKRMNNMRRDMEFKMNNRMNDMNKRMEEMQERVRKSQEDMMKRMNEMNKGMESTPSSPSFDIAPAPTKPAEFPMRGA